MRRLAVISQTTPLRSLLEMANATSTSTRGLATDFRQNHAPTIPPIVALVPP